jgi:PAS domain S-box-containing protein
MHGPKNHERKTVENDVKPAAENQKLEPLKQKDKTQKKSEHFRARTEELFHSITENSTDIIMIADTQGEVLYINNAGNKLREKTTLGNNAFDLLDNESRNRCKQAMEESLTTNKSVVIEQPGPNSTWWLVRFIPIEKLRYRVPVAVIICTEITEHKKIKDELERVNRALKVIVRCNETLVRSNNERHFLDDICKAIIKVKGYCLVWIGFAENDEFRTVLPVAHAGFEEGYLETLDINWADTERGQGPTGTAIRTGKPQVMRDIHQDPNYTPWRSEAMKRGYASMIALPLISEEQSIGTLNVYSDQLDAFGTKEVELLTELADDLAYGIKALRNRTERNRLTKELLNHRDMLRALTMELTLAEEHERHRIAQGIHDEIGQKLVMAKLELQQLEHSTPDSYISKSIGHLRNRLDEAITDIRSLTFELSNPLLFSEGLSAAVKSWLEQNILKKHGIKYEFISRLHAKCLDIEVRITLFQIIRELLINSVKHAKAGKVKVHIQEVNDNVKIKIEDDGIGFKTEDMLDTPAFSPMGGFGLFNVRERVDQLTGKFDIRSAPGKGTLVTITVSRKYNAQNTKPRDTKNFHF